MRQLTADPDGVLIVPQRHFVATRERGYLGFVSANLIKKKNLVLCLFLLSKEGHQIFGRAMTHESVPDTVSAVSAE